MEWMRESEVRPGGECDTWSTGLKPALLRGLRILQLLVLVRPAHRRGRWWVGQVSLERLGVHGSALSQECALQDRLAHLMRNSYGAWAEGTQARTVSRETDGR